MYVLKYQVHCNKNKKTANTITNVNKTKEIPLQSTEHTDITTSLKCVTNKNTDFNV